MLAIINLAVTAAYQPAPLVQNVVLMGLMAAIVALMLFILVEASNPFAGSDAILPTPFPNLTRPTVPPTWLDRTRANSKS